MLDEQLRDCAWLAHCSVFTTIQVNKESVALSQHDDEKSGPLDAILLSTHRLAIARY